MDDQPGQEHTASGAARRYRPGRRVSAASEAITAPVVSQDLAGMAVAYGNTLLFIGYEVNGLVEITVYPRYRFSSDDRVQGQLGYVWVPFGTPWEVALSQVEETYDAAQSNYRKAVTARAGEMRAHGAAFEAAYDAIGEVFRESWHGFALRLEREGCVVKEGMTFAGAPPDPVLVTWRGEEYTLKVFSTGSIMLLKGDRRKSLR